MNTDERNIVNIEKENFSERYELFYEAPVNAEFNKSIVKLKNDIFKDLHSSTGRKFVDVLVTTEELVREKRYIFLQNDVTEYYSKEGLAKRERELTKGPLFEPNVTLNDIVPRAQREDRGEGLTKPTPKMLVTGDVVKSLVTSGLDPIDVLCLGAEFSQIKDGEYWISQKELNRKDLGVVRRGMAIKMAEHIGINFEELMEYHRRVQEGNASAPSFTNAHDQHSFPSAQGGLFQRPVTIASHWYEHTLDAIDSKEALKILLNEREEYAVYDEVVDDNGETVITTEFHSVPRELTELIRLTGLAYNLHSSAAELIRSNRPLAPSLSNKYVLLTREAISGRAEKILTNSERIDQGNWLDLLSDQDIKNIVSLANKISSNNGSVDEDNVTEEEKSSVGYLDFVVEQIDKDRAINKLKSAIGDLRDKNIEDDEYISTIMEIITNLERDTDALYIHNLSTKEYLALLKLQEDLDNSILIDIAVPPALGCVRPDWKYRLDLDDYRDILINPFGDKNGELRNLLDILKTPFYENILKRGSVPRRVPMDFNNLEGLANEYNVPINQFKDDLANRIYGDLRIVDVLEGITADNIIDEYFKNLGVNDYELKRQVMSPSIELENPPSTLQNVDRAAHIIKEAILNREKIATIGDCDQDGFSGSVNWKWLIRRITGNNIDQKFNSRIEGHAVIPTDLFNLAMLGNKIIIINDTGSGDHDVDCFSLLHSGCRDISDLGYFREHISDFGDGTERLSPHETSQVKRILTDYLKNNTEIDKELLLNSRFTTGRKYFFTPTQEKVYLDEDSRAMYEKLLKTYYNEEGEEYRVKLEKEYRTLSSYKPFVKFMNGFPDVRIIVCDHHTPSISSTTYFRNNCQDVMVNPMWVKSGFEGQLIDDLEKALTPKKDGSIDINTLNEAQRKYICHPESDIVGTVVSYKVMRRIMQLFSNDPLKNIDADHLYSLDKKSRISKLKELKERDILTLDDAERKFLFDHTGKLEKSFFEMSTEEKERYAQEKGLIFVKALEDRIRHTPFSKTPRYDLGYLGDSVEEKPLEVDLVTEFQTMINSGKTLRDFKKVYNNIIVSAYSAQLDEDYALTEDTVERERLKDVQKQLRKKLLPKTNTLWKSTLESLKDSKSLTEEDVISLKSYFRFGPYGLEYPKFVAAYATLGDGGSVGVNEGMENRWIIKDAMRSLDEFTRKYEKAKGAEKNYLRRIMPPIFRVLRASLRGVQVSSLNWYESRLMTHQMAAFINSIYRRGKEEEAERAGLVLNEIADFAERVSPNEKTVRHSHTLPVAQEKTIEIRERMLKETLRKIEEDPTHKDKSIIVAELIGDKYTDPTHGMRGLIAGNIASIKQKPTVILVKNKDADILRGKPAIYSASFRLPGRGNIACDMVLLNLEKNPVEGIKVLEHGGHPEAAGGTFEVFGGKERLEEVLDQEFSNFAVTNPYEGVVNIESAISKTSRELNKNGKEVFKRFVKYVNVFDIAEIIASHLSKQLNPYGIDMPKLLLELEDINVINVSKGKNGKEETYIALDVEDKRGNSRVLRVFEEYTDLNNVQKEDKVNILVQPIQRLITRPPAEMIYHIPIDDGITVKTILGGRTKPKLNVEKFLNIQKAK